MQKINIGNEYQPKVFIKQEETDSFLNSHPDISYVDAFSRQLKELFFIENTEFIGKNKEEVYVSKDFNEYLISKKEQYAHIYYPWNNHLVKCVQENDYFKLKTNRNQDLITAEEQKKLYGYNVAVFGMSVGSNIAFILTQAGISKKIIIADFDELDTTNLNRILAGVHQVGLNKTIVAARRIYEDNPFADVRMFSNGISAETLAPLLERKEIDCIVEEIDNIKVKIDIRLLALKHKVPVIMITDNGDGIVLHIERYDLGYRKIFHQDPEYWKEKIGEKSEPSKDEAGKIIVGDIVGGADKVDPKMMASVKRVLNKELVSWSQLGSAAMLGGVVATVAIKRIVLEESKNIEVRKYITLSDIY